MRRLLRVGFRRSAANRLGRVSPVRKPGLFGAFAIVAGFPWTGTTARFRPTCRSRGARRIHLAYCPHRKRGPVLRGKSRRVPIAAEEPDGCWNRADHKTIRACFEAFDGGRFVLESCLSTNQAVLLPPFQCYPENADAAERLQSRWRAECNRRSRKSSRSQQDLRGSVGNGARPTGLVR